MGQGRDKAGATAAPRPVTEAESRSSPTCFCSRPRGALAGRCPRGLAFLRGGGPKALVCTQSRRGGAMAANSSTWGSVGVTSPSPLASHCHQVSPGAGFTCPCASVDWPRGTPHETLKAGSLTPLGGRGGLWDCPGTTGHWELVGSRGPPQGTHCPREECVPGTLKSL